VVYVALQVLLCRDSALTPSYIFTIAGVGLRFLDPN